MQMIEALERSRAVPPQEKVDILQGLKLRRTKNGIPIISLHYSADPDRDPNLHPEWKARARAGYSSQAAWDREQEIVDRAGGGALVFADTLVTHWDKIVITDRSWRPDPMWSVIGGFDHGKSNPTCLGRAYMDYQGNIYICGEYYMPGKSVWEHAPVMKTMPDVDRFEACYADPTVFDQKTQQEKGKEPKAISQVYFEEGITFLTRFGGNRNDQLFAERLLSHWSDLEHREPTLKIVCRNFADRPQPGLHPWDSPNLLWELLRARRKKLSQQQLLTQNSSEEIVDKDNHARDVLKYIVNSLPEPTQKTQKQRIMEAMQPHIDRGDLTNAHLAHVKMQKEIEQEDDSLMPSWSARQRLRMAGRRGMN